jgi:hypothetical protein
MNEVVWFIVAVAAIVAAVVLFIIWLRSGTPTEVEEGNQWGQLGQGLAVLEEARNNPDFRPSTTFAIDRTIQGIVDLVNGRFGPAAEELAGRRRVIVTTPHDVEVEVHNEPPEEAGL